MVASVKERMRYYDYWIKFLNQLKKILSLDDFYEMEADLMKLVQCIDFDYCEGYATDGVHRIWFYNWKAKIFKLLSHLMSLQETRLHHHDYFHEEIIENWETLLKTVKEEVDVNLLIINGELLNELQNFKPYWKEE